MSRAAARSQQLGTLLVAGGSARGANANEEAGKRMAAARGPITTHVLDQGIGRPAAGVRVELRRHGAGGEVRVEAQRLTDADGRVADLLPAGTQLARGDVYEMWFATREYFERSGGTCFYPFVSIVFTVEDPAKHLHVPLLLAPYGYSTYRGS